MLYGVRSGMGLAEYLLGPCEQSREKLYITAGVRSDGMHLIIAEKHDAAKRIAQILAGSKPNPLA